MRILRVVLAMLGLALAGGGALADDKGWLGVELTDITKEEADALGWDGPRGAKVVKPAAGGPAGQAGLAEGDIVLSLDGREVESVKDFIDALTLTPPGSQARLRVTRAGRERRVSLVRGIGVASDRERTPLQLMLETGGHMSVIRDLIFTRDGRFIVSAGDDKVIRVWEWGSGKIVRSIRGATGPGSAGKIFALALSPDEKWLAVAGLMRNVEGTGTHIRLYDFASGDLKGLLKGHMGGVNALAFSPDGKRLVSGGGRDDEATILWDVESQQPVQTLRGHSAPVNAVGFTPDGARVVSGSRDRTLRLWRVADGHEIAVLNGHKDKIFSLAVSPEDGTIASGSDDGEIRLWDGNTGVYLRTLATQPTAVGALVFSPKGETLLSGVGFQGVGSDCHVWDIVTGKEIHRYKGHDNIVLAAGVSSDGHFAATGGGSSHEIHVWKLLTGERVNISNAPLRLGGVSAFSWSTGIAQDGQYIAWGTADPCPGEMSCPRTLGRLQWRLQLPNAIRKLGRPEPIGVIGASALVDWRRYEFAHGDFTIDHRAGGKDGHKHPDGILDVRKDGVTLSSIARGTSDGFGHRAYSFGADGRTILSGGEGGTLTAYNLDGTVQGEFIGHESDLASVATDGRYLVSGSADQTIRLWNVETRELIVTLFHGTDGNWVMWTPQGYYTGSPGADKIVGWQINNGLDRAADFVGADQLRQHLNRPDIVERAVILASAEKAVKEAPGTNFKLADLLARPVPRFRVVSPVEGAIERQGRVLVTLDIEATPDPVKLIRIQVNGRQVAEVIPETGGGFAPGQRLLDVPMARGHNGIRISAINEIGEKTETLTLTHEGEGALDKRGALYILAIGADKYPFAQGKLDDLEFAGNDARAFAAAVEKRLGPAHEKVVSQLLMNAPDSKAPTASNIRDAFDVLRQAAETDTVIVFLAGHGVNDGPSYRFLPTDAEPLGSGWKTDKAIPWYALEEVIHGAKGRRLLFVDTCHAGNAFNQRLENASYHANVIAYSSARWDQAALEWDDVGHGLFTYAVVEGIGGEGDTNADREIGAKELHDFVAKRVDALAKTMNKEQNPQYYRGRDAEDHVLARW